MEEMRLQKFLANSGVCSRRSAEKLILEGKIESYQRLLLN